MTEAEQRRWMEQWRGAQAALHEQRRKDLRELTPELARAKSDALLALAAGAPISAERWRSSGLVVLQALLHGRRPE